MGPFTLAKISRLSSGWAQDTACTLGHPRMDASHTQLGVRVGLNMG